MNGTRLEMVEGFWAGGEIDGYQFHQLNLDRVDILMEMRKWAGENQLQLTRYALALYLEEDVRRKGLKQSDWEHPACDAGAIPLHVVKRFEEGFEADMNALFAGAAQVEGGDADDSEPGK